MESPYNTTIIIKLDLGRRDKVEGGKWGQEKRPVASRVVLELGTSGLDRQHLDPCVGGYLNTQFHSMDELAFWR